MRRDIYIENDSGGFSVIAAAAAGDIIDDDRSDDFGFVESHRAMLLELVGDDSLPIRVVVGEELTPQEDAEWLACASWRIDAPDGRLLVMGGFDPDVLSWWRDAGDPDADGRGVGAVTATPGSWRVDVYAHAGSMNGRAILDERDEPLGTFFRRSHPERPFPVWLANRLDFSGDDDPGHEDLWGDIAASYEDGRLPVDLESGSAVGFVIHLTPFDGSLPPLPEDGWFGHDHGRRDPDACPLGLKAEVEDPGVEWFLDRLLKRERPAAPMPVASEMVEIIETWPGEPLRALDGEPIPLAPEDAFHLYWIAALASDSPPAFEYWVSDAPGWTPPEPTEGFAVTQKANGIWAIGAPPNWGGWWMWWSARDASKTLAGVPDGATLDLATAPRTWDVTELDPEVGRTLWSGKVENGRWMVSELSPAVGRDVLADAVEFVRQIVVEEQLLVRGAEERAAFEASPSLMFLGQNPVEWDGQRVHLTDPDSDERELLMLADPVFRTRYGSVWPVDTDDDDDED